MPKTNRSNGDNAAVTTPKALADRLYRAAAETVRQRKRYARLVASGVQEDEQQGALTIACICYEVLTQSVAAYEGIAMDGTAHRDEEWWPKANAIWQASREYERRHQECDQNSRKFTAHSRRELVKLAMEYDLEASALLALQQALNAYRKAFPEVELDASISARVA
jgi:hypothetical protein